LNKIVSIKKTSAIFLAIVLVTGTIALAVQSFSVEAQATSDREKDYDNDEKDSYGKDRDRNDESRDHDKDYDEDDKKSHGKDKDDDKSKKDSNSVSIKKVKCNNINLNLNGIDADIRLPINGVIAEAQAAEDEGTNSFEKSGGKSNDKKGQSDSDRDYRFVCINNNNNIVAIGEPEPPTCEECFTKVLSEEEEKLDDLIQAIEVASEGEVSSLQELCELFTEVVQDEGFRAFISETLFTLGGDVRISEDKINEILDCLEELFGEDFPREFNGEPLTVQQMNWKSWK
jgi:hypothetical protein